MQPSEPDVPAYGPALETDPNVANRAPTEAGIPPETRERVLRSANWFFWIAALSLVNSLAMHSGSRWQFMLGLGITEVADVIAGQFGGPGVAVAVVFDLLTASVFAGFGLMARRMVIWPFVVGMVVYALDGGLLLVVGDYLSAAFHGYALYCIYLGVSALRQRRAAV